MKAHVATAIHAYLLILVGLYKFNDSSAPIDLLVSVVFAVPLLTLNSGVKYGIKPALNISTFLSLSSVIVLSGSFCKSWYKSDLTTTFANALVVVSGILALIILLVYFITERRKKHLLK